MKTPEEWVQDKFNENLNYEGSFDVLTSNKELLEIVKQIQLDAWKQGMTCAATLISNAKILQDIPEEKRSDTTNYYNAYLEAANEAITIERDSKTAI